MIALRVALVLSMAAVPAVAQIQTPEQFFGFVIGTDGELAKYPRVLEYMRHLTANSNRVHYEELGKTAMGNPYVMVRFSSPENLSNLDRLVEINRTLADPRGLGEEEAAQLSEEGRVFLFLYATIHSTEVGNGQTIIEIAHELATGGLVKGSGDPGQHRGADGALPEPGWAGPGHRPLLQVPGHRVLGSVSGSVSQVHRSR